MATKAKSRALELGSTDRRLDDVLDAFAPEPIVREVHRRAAALGSEQLIAAVREVTWLEVPLLRRLTAGRFGGRRVQRNQPILDGFCESGPYVRLVRTERDEVVGLMVDARQCRPVEGRAPTDFAAPLRGGTLMILLGFSASEQGCITTETRVAASGRVTRLTFRLYWLVIRAPSGLIRRSWLRAIVRRAAASAARSSE